MRIKGVKPPEIKFKKVEKGMLDRPLAHMHDAIQYSIGFGRVGKGFNTGSTTPPKFRTFIRVRSSVGICSYIYRTYPERGKIVPTCRYYTMVREISRDECIELIGKTKTEKLE